MVEPLTDSIVDELFSAGPLLLHAGAGISMESPARAPSAWRVAAASYERLVAASGLLLQTDIPGDVYKALANLPKGVLPEILYSAVSEAYGQDIHDQIWIHLGINTPIYNIGHELYCELAARGDGSIISTTNYDTFFECAAMDLGYKYDVMGVEGLDPQNRPTQGNVHIVKLHGDASKSATIVSKLPDLTRMASQMMRCGPHPRRRTAVIVGYSGRDLDVFPWIAREGSFDKIYWIGPSFELDHRARTIPSGVECRLLSGKFEELESLQVDRKQPSSLVLAKICEDAASKAIDSLGPMRSNEARFAIARTLSDRGLHSEAAWIAATIDLGEFSKAAPLLCHALASQDQYQESMRVTIPQDSPVDAATTGLMIAFSRLVYGAKVIDPANGQSARIIWTRQLLPTARYIINIGRFARHGTLALRQAKKAELNSTISDHRLAFEWLETLIRLYSLVQYFLPERLSRSILNSIDKSCHDSGYVRGALNIEKYLNRLERNPSMDLSPRFRMLEDLTGAAIELRDQARKVGPKTLRGVTSDEFEHLTFRAVDLAQQSGSTLTLVECELLRREARLSMITSPRTLSRAIDSIQVRSLASSRRREVLRHYLLGDKRDVY